MSRAATAVTIKVESGVMVRIRVTVGKIGVVRVRCLRTCVVKLVASSMEMSFAQDIVAAVLATSTHC